MPYYPERNTRNDYERGIRGNASTAHPDVQANSARAAAWRVFFEASGRLQGILETRLKRAYGVSMPDYNILLALWEAPSHRLRMGELADRVVYSPSRVTYLSLTSPVTAGSSASLPRLIAAATTHA